MNNFPTGARVTFAAMRGDYEITLSGVVTDSRLTRRAGAWRTVRVDNGPTLEVMARHLEVAS